MLSYINHRDSITNHNKVLIFFFLVLCILGTNSLKAQNLPNNSDCHVCLSAKSYPQLASLQTDDGLLSQLIFNQLLGTNIDLTALNWQGLVQNDFQVQKLLLNIAFDQNLSSPKAVLEQDLTIDQILSALVDVADNQGTITALNKIINANTTSSTIKLTEALNIETFDESLADIKLDYFSFLNTVIQLYNFKNVAVTNSPLAINIPLLGDVVLQAQVVEPPNIICGKTSTQMFSAGIRLKMEIDIVDVGLNVTVPGSALIDIDLSINLTDLELYVDIARGLTTISTVNNTTNQVDITAIPGIARMFLGTIDNEIFFDRLADPAGNLDYTTIGNMDLDIPILGNFNVGLTAKSNGDATSVAEALSNLTLPFDQTFGNSSVATSLLVNDMLMNTDVNITSSSFVLNLIADILDYILDDVIANVSQLLFASNGVIDDVLDFFVDPLLESFGIGIGEIIVAGDEIIESCFDFGDAPNIYNTLLVDDGPRHFIDDSLYLGALSPESDADGIPHNSADLDLEDDCLSSFPEKEIGTTYAVSIMVTNMSNDPAQVVGWIDFDEDSVYEDNYERSLIGLTENVPANYTGLVLIEWEGLPTDYDPNMKFARFRISSDPSFFDSSTVSPLGHAINGEVEDYLINQSTVPLDLLKFEVTDVNNVVNIDWTTTNEINLQEYQVERSHSGVDFERINSQGPQFGETQNINKYRYSDRDEFTGSMYYRLKSVDFDGQVSYSSILDVQRKPSIDVQVLPNPCSDYINITFNNDSESNTEIKVYDAQQKLLSSQIISRDTKQLQIDMSSYADGIYLLNITTNSQIQSRMIVKN